jgi:threonine synthase
MHSVKFSGPIGFWRYKQVLPFTHQIISLGEGGTPLHKAERLAKTMGLSSLYLKDETRNPTNSYRDRAAALITSNALDQDVEALVCATNGNMGASLSAYGAKTGLTCHLLVPKVVDVGKLAQMIAYDAVIEESGETIDDSIKKAANLAKETGWYQATAELNPLELKLKKQSALRFTSNSVYPSGLLFLWEAEEASTHFGRALRNLKSWGSQVLCQK